MSSTNRGGKRSPADFYPTPPYCVVRLLEALHQYGPPGLNYILPGGTWLEPCAGDGAIIRAVARMRDDVDFHAHELREECEPELVKIDAVSKVSFGDFLLRLPDNAKPMPYAVAITNPPFSIAMDVLTHCMLFSPIVIMLLRLNYLESEDRCEFMRKHCPDLYVLPNRPSFAGNGSTDSITYAWFVWRDSLSLERSMTPRRVGAVQVLASTPKEHRTHNALDLLVPPR